MRKEGRAEWLGGKKDSDSKEVAWIYWRTPEEWAGLIYDWVRSFS
jgi:ESCRT-II complex subunit VPS25